MITRNALHGIIFLLAGLAAGYFAFRCSEIPESVPTTEFPLASVTSLGSLYDQNKEQFQEVVSRGSAMVRETALRKQVLEQSSDSIKANYENYKQLISQAAKDLAILRLQDYYTQFYMHYFRWLDTGDGQSAVQYKLALGQFKATLNYTLENEGQLLSPLQIKNLRTFIRIVEQSDRSIRWAKVLVVVLIFLLVMGIPRFIRTIGYKRFAASLYFDAIFRPNLISQLNSWHSTQRMALALPGLYLFAFVIISSFISWRIPLIFGLLGLLPVMLYIGLSYSTRKLGVLGISFLAPKMLLIILVLGIVAVRGPMFFWYRIWGMDLFRLVFLSLFFMLIFHKIHVNMILIRKWSHRNRCGSAAIVALAVGLQLLLAGTLLYIFGTAESLVALNMELLLQPDSLIGFSPELRFWLMLIALITSVTALIFILLNRKRGSEISKS